MTSWRYISEEEYVRVAMEAPPAPACAVSWDANTLYETLSGKVLTNNGEELDVPEGCYVTKVLDEAVPEKWCHRVLQLEIVVGEVQLSLREGTPVALIKKSSLRRENFSDISS